MSKTILKPARKDILVPNPGNGNKPLAEAGEEITMDRYWQRRLKDGDVAMVKAVSTAKAKKS